MGQLTTPRVSADQRQPMLRVVIAVLLLAATTVAFGIFNPGAAHAADPVITGPYRVFTFKDVPLAFTGNDLIAVGTSKVISITAQDKPDNFPADPGCSPSDDRLGGCSSVKLDVNHGGLTLTPGNAVVTAGDPTSLTGTGTIQMTGLVADLNTALQTLVYHPDSGYTNTPNVTDSNPPAEMSVNAIDGLSGDNTNTDNQTKWIQIRVDTLNSFPTEDHPTGPFTMPAGTDKTFTGNPQPYLIKDSDVKDDSGNMLVIAWVDCGTFSMSQSGNLVLGNNLKLLLENQAGLDPTVADAIFAFLPAAVKNLPLSTSVDGVTAFAGIGQLDDWNNTLSTVTFHAPTTASDCTLTQIVDDLGNEGLPATYQNLTHVINQDPTGIETPAMGFAIPQTEFIVTVPQVTVEQAAGQADPTPDSPIHFTATFTDDMQGFDTPATDVTIGGTAGATTAVITPIDAKTYDIAVTGMTQTGTVTASVPAGAAQAVYNNAVVNAASTSTDNTVTFKLPPTVTINQGATQVDPTSTSPIVFDVTFSQGVTGFTAADVDLSASTAGGPLVAAVSVVDASHYTVSVTGMSADGTVVASIPADAANDAQLVALTSAASTSTDNSVTWKQPTPPTVTINQGAAQVDPTSTSPIVFDVVFSETVSGFTAADVVLSASTAGGTLVPVVTQGVDAAHYTVSVSGMTTSGDVIATIPGSAATSIASSLPSVASSSTDNTVTWQQPPAPTVTINQGATQVDPTSTSPIVFDVVFSEPITGFTNADVALSGTAGATAVSVAQVAPMDGTHFTASVSGMTTSGTVIADIPAAAATSVATSQPSDASTSTDNVVQFDKPVAPIPPTVTINQGAAQADPTSTSPISFDVVFSETVTGFTNADVTLSGTAGATTAVVTQGVDAAHYTVAVSGMTSSGTVIADIPANAATSIASSLPSDPASHTDNVVTYDKPVPVPPTTTVSVDAGQANPTSVSPITFDVVFSETVSGFTAADLTLTGTAGATTGVVTQGVDSAHYTVAVSGMTSSGDVTLSVGPSLATGTVSGLGNLSSNSATVTYDKPVPVPPTTTVSVDAGQANPTSASPITFDVVFSETVSGFTAADLTLTGTAGATTGVVTQGVDSAHYTVAVSGMTSSGSVTLSVGPSLATGTVSGLGNLSSNSATVNYTKPTPPTVTIDQAIGQADPTSTSPIDFTVVFSEGVTGFSAGDVDLTGSSAGGVLTPAVVAIDASHYTVHVTGMTTSGDVIATVPASAAVAQSSSLPSAASTSTDNTVTWVAQDGSSPLAIQVPPDKTVFTDPGKPGANVTFAAATSTGGVAPVTITCNASSGDFFLIGTTLITCTATDSANEGLIRGAHTPLVEHRPLVSVSGQFIITVLDNEAPTISHPDITVHTTNPNGTTVDYGPSTVADNSGQTPTVACTIATLTNFAVGTTPVTCTATDPSQNTASVTFNVNVIFDTVATTQPTTTTAPVTTTAQLPTQIPATGSDSGQSLRLAVVLSVVGFLLLIFARRRKVQL